MKTVGTSPLYLRVVKQLITIRGLSPVCTRRESARSASGRLAHLQTLAFYKGPSQKKYFPLKIRFFSYRPSAESRPLPKLSLNPPNHLQPSISDSSPLACYPWCVSTAKQIAANRLNAQKSSGPRSAQGKAASRANSLKRSEE